MNTKESRSGVIMNLVWYVVAEPCEKRKKNTIHSVLLCKHNGVQSSCPFQRYVILLQVFNVISWVSKGTISPSVFT